MDSPTVYIETTIPSFYCEVRTDVESAARSNWTREWWDERRTDYFLVTSQVVHNELDKGTYPTKDRAMGLLAELPLLPLDEEVAEIVQCYLDRMLMPKDPANDAWHLALASYHECDYLLTWNCRHLANANKFDRIERINAELGLTTPRIVTPLELIGENNETRSDH